MFVDRRVPGHKVCSRKIDLVGTVDWRFLGGGGISWSNQGLMQDAKGRKSKE